MALRVVPARATGWNRFTLTADIADADLPAYFVGAHIVWRGTAAYSPNAIIAQLIGTTPGITALSAFAAGDEIWVRY